MEYKYFIFDGISSDKFNLTIQNNGEDLMFPSQANFENQIVSPLYQGTSYLAGVNKKDREFKLNCWVDSLTIARTREMLNWLSVNKISYLSLDYNPNFQYQVKLSSISDFKHFAINNGNTSNYEFTLSFTTIGEFAAESKTTYTDVSGLNDDGFSKGWVSGNDIYFCNMYNLPFYVNFTINSILGFSISKNDIPYYQYLKDGSFTLDSKTGICLNNKRLIEEYLNEGDPFVNLGQLSIDSNIHTTVAVVDENGADLNFDPSFHFTLNMRMYPENSTTLYSALNYYNIVTDLNLQIGDQILIYYFEPTKITITPGVTYSFKYRDNF